MNNLKYDTYPTLDKSVHSAQTFCYWLFGFSIGIKISTLIMGHLSPSVTIEYYFTIVSDSIMLVSLGALLGCTYYWIGRMGTKISNLKLKLRQVKNPFHYPPTHFNCRCVVTPATQMQNAGHFSIPVVTDDIDPSAMPGSIVENGALKIVPVESKLGSFTQATPEQLASSKYQNKPWAFRSLVPPYEWYEAVWNADQGDWVAGEVLR